MRRWHIFLIVMIALGCRSCHPSTKLGSDTNAEHVKTADDYLYYIEAHDEVSSVSSGNFGDVVLFDIQSRKKIKFTDDEFVDEYPSLSPDRQHLVFASSRSGGKELLKIVGLGGPRSLYIVDADRRDIRPFAVELQSKNRDKMDEFRDLQWSSDGKALYFHLKGKEVLYLSSDGQNFGVFIRLDKIDKILHMQFSPDGQMLAVNYLKTDSGNGIRLIHLADRRAEDLTVESQYPAIGSWSRDQESFTYVTYKASRYSWFEYSLPLKLSRHIWFSEAIREDKIDYLMDMGNYQFLMLAEHGRDQSRFFPRGPSREFAIYSEKSGTIEWITDDGLDKDYVGFQSQH